MRYYGAARRRFCWKTPPTYFTDLPADPEIGDDLGLLDAIMQRSNCHLLLDLHNVHCNAVNHGTIRSRLWIATLDRVVEIHVAGGSWHNGFWMDRHNGPVPSQVWDLLAYTLSRAP